ncbi:MAG: DmsC/YnfH family molybdoenzyme membrane anchor subunit [Opitutaceae bacterium]|jgi:Fe-S-cluster-containing dehydrogenase component/DMSO reductase anchor subunit
MTDPVRTLIDELIESQRRLDTPVARFAAAHDSGSVAQLSALETQLIPLTAPGPGEQYAFQVDLDSCSGCKSCVAGCHSLNGLDENETWRDVGLVLGSASDVGRPLAGAPTLLPFQQTVTTACHHCADPACLNGCPVLAYEKDPVTGIVRHLDDQCIGCQYCVLKCPYDVPKFNERLGIVRKCDMCHDRLSEGEAPACVQACPTHAITIVKVSTFTSETPASHAQLAALSSTDSGYTQPTTRYVSKNPLPANLHAADARTLRPQHAHLPLVALLVGTQVGLGVMLASMHPGMPAWVAGLGWGIFFVGLAISGAHLGKPLRAWRVFLNLRRSWLSREAIVLGNAFAPLSAYVAAHLGLIPSLDFLPKPLPDFVNLALSFAGPAGIVFGFLGVFCSAMIYVDTRRRFWRPTQSIGRMAGSVLIGALAFINLPLAALALAAKLALELTTLSGQSSSARLQRGPLKSLLVLRLALAALALISAFLLPSYLFPFFLLLGELAERALYFRAVDSPKMPGVPTA